VTDLALDEQKTGTEGEATVEPPLPDRGAIAFILRQARAAPSRRRRTSRAKSGLAGAEARDRIRSHPIATIAVRLRHVPTVAETGLVRALLL